VNSKLEESRILCRSFRRHGLGRRRLVCSCPECRRNVHERGGGVARRESGQVPVQRACASRRSSTGATPCHQKKPGLSTLRCPGPVVNQRSPSPLDQATSVLRRRRCSIIASTPATSDRALEPVAGSISGTAEATMVKVAA